MKDQQIRARRIACRAGAGRIASNNPALFPTAGACASCAVAGSAEGDGGVALDRFTTRQIDAGDKIIGIGAELAAQRNVAE